MNLTYGKANINDLDQIFEVFRTATLEMNRNNIPQWDEIYPDIDILRQDIEKNELFVGKLGSEIAVVFVLNREADKQYQNGDWKYPDAVYRILHRFCVNPHFQNCKVGSRTLDYMEHMLSKEGIEALRLDAFSLNPYALKMYQKAGYRKAGEVHFRKGLFYLMEKSLK